MLLGLDVSEHQITLPPPSPYSFAFVKVWENRADRRWVDHVATLLEANVKVGPYCYGRPLQGPVDQAHAFLGEAGRVQWELPPVLDIETTDGESETHIAEWVLAFCEAVEHFGGRTPIIYTYTSFLGYLQDERLARFPLWIADYPHRNVVRTEYGRRLHDRVAPWSGWTFWQYTSNNGTVDENLFNGTQTDLDALVGITQSGGTFLSALTPEEQREVYDVLVGKFKYTNPDAPLPDLNSLVQSINHYTQLVLPGLIGEVDIADVVLTDDELSRVARAVVAEHARRLVN